ncbi:hypothetical protein [Clostridium minihomine]|uniref:hypothetical protein n=1 Tax=Clostridium minihomine TaxID=2045012 RepID=UPI000C78D286|nr:hypothetical protein [Clostridium minihomine]
MTNLNNNANPEVLEEMKGSLTEIESVECNSKVKLDSQLWDIKLKYGKLKAQKHFTYAIKVICKTGKQEEDCFLYSAFTGKEAESIRKEMDNWGSCDLEEFEKLKRYAEYLKLKDIYSESDLLDDLLENCEEEENSINIEEYKKQICSYIENNYESIALKSENTFKMDAYTGAWLDTPRLMKKYDGEIVLALLNSKVDELLEITDTKKLGLVKGQMEKEGFLVFKKPQDVTLSTGNEKKCSIFRISPDKE